MIKKFLRNEEEYNKLLSSSIQCFTVLRGRYGPLSYPCFLILEPDSENFAFVYECDFKEMS